MEVNTATSRNEAADSPHTEAQEASALASVYGHRHLGWWFHSFLTVTPTGFKYQDKAYAWSDIVRVEERDYTGINWGTAKRRASVHLKDGKKIALNCRALELAGTRPKVNFWTTKTDAYEELLEKFRRAL